MYLKYFFQIFGGGVQHAAKTRKELQVFMNIMFQPNGILRSLTYEYDIAIQMLGSSRRRRNEGGTNKRKNKGERGAQQNETRTRGDDDETENKKQQNKNNNTNNKNTNKQANKQR